MCYNGDKPSFQFHSGLIINENLSFNLNDFTLGSSVWIKQIQYYDLISF